jgi:hypothetical protein
MRVRDGGLSLYRCSRGAFPQEILSCEAIFAWQGRVLTISEILRSGLRSLNEDLIFSVSTNHCESGTVQT